MLLTQIIPQLPLLLLQPLLLATLLSQAARTPVTPVDPTNTSAHSINQPWFDTASGAQFFSARNVANLSASSATAAKAEAAAELESNSGSQQHAKRERQPRRPRVKDPEVEADKQGIIKDFVREHGKRIRESRRHADLFDGAGYLMDLHEELHQFEFKAKKERQGDRKAGRKRRSVIVDSDGKPDDKGDNEEEEVEEELDEIFDSLSDALAHLNGRHQADTLSAPGFNMVFKDTGAEKYTEEANVQEGKGKDEATAGKRRSRRSAEAEEDEQDEDREEELARQLEAEQSLERLDANLREFAQLLDDDAELEREAGRQTSSQGRQGDWIPLENYNRRLSEAYKGLLTLRNIAGDLLEKQKTATRQRQEQRARPTRMPFEFLEKAANWQIDADTVREQVRELHRLHRKMEEL